VEVWWGEKRVGGRGERGGGERENRTLYQDVRYIQVTDTGYIYM